MPGNFRISIHWFRRDLRISDNTALLQAAACSERVLPTYVLSSWQGSHAWTGPNRQEFLCRSLASLAANLKTLSGRLILRSGAAVEEIIRLAEESKAEAVFFNRDPDPFGKKTEELLEARCRRLGIQALGFDDVALHRPDEILTKSEEPYRVFTPFYRNWQSREKAAPARKPAPLHTPSKLPSHPLPQLSHWKLGPAGEILEGGERAALKRMKSAISHAGSYDDRRNEPAADGATRLSQDLRFGLISVRSLHSRLQKAASENPAGRPGIESLIRQLAWREFYFAILHHYPEVLVEEFNPVWRGLPWDEPGAAFEAWKQGRTGFPIVDAGMRELLSTGHMHNRLRMITAMFLTKDLHLDWRLGEQHFMQHLADGEIASNNGGWQWSAGTGADAAPYFRIQNPWTQSGRYDADGAYIKHWIPELESVPVDQLHTPPPSGEPLAKGYPLPCVDHRIERQRTLAIFKRHKELQAT